MSDMIERFVRHGFVVVEDAIDPAVCERLVTKGFRRLGVDERDRASWPVGWHNFPPLEVLSIDDVAPRAADVLRALLGGGDAIRFAGIPDNLIFSFPSSPGEWWPPAAWRDHRNGFHKDGDWFRHFLDSPEQGILGVIFWRDVTERQGPTYVATDSVAPVARFLAEHPEGMEPGALPTAQWLANCRDFRALTGRQGTIVWAHPFMVHTASANATDRVRIISNSAVTLRSPMQFDRADGAYTLVERSILDALGVDRFVFTPTRPRERVVPERERRWEREAAEHAARLGDA